MIRRKLVPSSARANQWPSGLLMRFNFDQVPDSVFFELHQSAIGPERQSQHPVTVSRARAHAGAHGGVAADETGAHPETQTTAAMMLDPVRYRRTVAQLRRFVRRPQFYHRLIICVMADPAVPV